MKFTRAQCQPVVEFFLNALQPNCERLEVAGSWRREKQLVGDLEFAFVPKVVQEPDGLFETKAISLPDKLIESWLSTGVITKRMTDVGPGRVSSWGPLNKHAVHIASGIGVDFFAETDIRDWWRTLVIRTGPKDFNIRLMATAPKRGIVAHAYGEAFHRQGGERVFAYSEDDVLNICGLEWAEPKDRR